MIRNPASELNPPCAYPFCALESDTQCTGCAGHLCREHTRTCSECKGALCRECAKAVVLEGTHEHLCPKCTAKHDCREWISQPHGGCDTEPHGEATRWERWECAVCGADVDMDEQNEREAA